MDIVKLLVEGKFLEVGSLFSCIVDGGVQVVNSIVMTVPSTSGFTTGLPIHKKRDVQMSSRDNSP